MEIKNKSIYDKRTNKKLCNLLNNIAEEHFKQRCKHPEKYLKELPEQENKYLWNRKAKCLKCGAILMGYLGKNELKEFFY